MRDQTKRRPSVGGTILDRLNAFYDRHEILPDRFRCAHASECSAGSPDFTEAKASFVGPSYDDRLLPRLLFLSLDSGSGRRRPRERTAEAVRRRELERDLATLPKGRHWYRTHEMAHMLLRQFQPGLEFDDARLHFAHVNSAKCCQNNRGRKQAAAMLFRNCRRFIPEELRILRPDIIVTQGAYAKKAIRECFHVDEYCCRCLPTPNYVRGADYETGIVRIGSRDPARTFWIHTHHPTSHGYFHPQRRYCWPLYVKAVGEFWRSRR